MVGVIIMALAAKRRRQQLLQASPQQWRQRQDTFMRKADDYSRKIPDFIQLAEEGSRAVVQQYKNEGPDFFHGTFKFAEAVKSAAFLPVLAESWLQWFMEDKFHRKDMVDFLRLEPKPTFMAANKELRRLRNKRLASARSNNNEMEWRS